TVGEQVFVAMEYVDGPTLRAWRDGMSPASPEHGPHQRPEGRTPRAIVAMYVQAGRGLEAAHAAGILHRDFKPENAMVDARGRARVLDFGLARIDAPASHDDVAMMTTGIASGRSSSAQLTHFGALVGTPAYMAPEQLRGERADPRSDQFAFCVALYEAL